MYEKLTRLFLRIAIAAGFLSAVADRFGWWNYHIAWGSWDKFEEYVQILIPWAPESLINPLAILATVAEIIFAVFLLIGFKVNLFAKLSGLLLLVFALSMWTSTGIKTVFDASVLAAAGAAFGLGAMKPGWFEFGNKTIEKN
ncbi:MAG: DoxX family membrane protein [Flavobacteriia bacterium]|nr:DoxX family membrane protein [Flavobacteriia bacterium]